MANNNNEEKARQLLLQAEKKLGSSKGILSSLFGSPSKTEEAAELFVRAANAFKMAKNWASAGQCFCRAAQLQISLQSRHEAASHYVDAGNAYKKADPNEAINSLLKAVEIYTDMGRFTIAAKHHITVAEIYENEMADIEQAISHYEQAADYYKGEESTSAANKCFLKVAQYSAQLEQYQKAIDIYEEVASASMENSLLKYSAKDHFFRAALCHMCNDIVNAKLVIPKYEEMFPAFSDSRECNLLKTVLDSMDNIEAFTKAVSDYDSISRLDQWLTMIFLRIKNKITEEEENIC
ncbi:alpha-soluble NSF attachment protein [Octopus vulgaris]|uniref:Alpha-soluble NSF attachment protein n=2 Tax=Octopus TaxID=6643 RepID=A0AA36BB92_OCTVU|nr:alpha-soluble NSF attachment protein [Octopus sinensis]CAI9730361.1 alpha-soluble NSF attachment protein [Octopus vulgaris]